MKDEPFPQVVPAGSPSRGGDVAVYVFGLDQPRSPTPYNLVLYPFQPSSPFQLYFMP